MLVQGTTLGLVIRWARLREDEGAQPPLEIFAAETVVLKARFAAVERLAYDADGKLIHPQLLESHRRRAAAAANFQGTAEYREQAIAAHFDVIIASIAAGRVELVRLHRATKSTTRSCTISSTTSTSKNSARLPPKIPEPCKWAIASQHRSSRGAEFQPRGPFTKEKRSSNSLIVAAEMMSEFELRITLRAMAASAGHTTTHEILFIVPEMACSSK